MKQKLEALIADSVKQLFKVDLSIELSRPDQQFGDYATNVALRLAADQHSSPKEVAEQLAASLKSSLKDYLKEVNVAGPGFLNLRLSDQALWQAAAETPNRQLAGQVIVAEYSDPNPFKLLHAGHLYTSIVGDAIANLLEAAGGEVHRVNYGGDVGLHVGKCLWAVIQELGGELPEKLQDIKPNIQAEWLSAAYVRGNQAYENDESAKAAINQLNTQVYKIQDSQDHDSNLAKIYWTCREWSYQSFDQFYERIGSHFEKFYPESETAPIGIKAVKEQLGKVFEQSDGAVVFRGEAHNLHTRVFINSQGLPTYEAKDIGLIIKKWQDYHFDHSIVITGNEQAQYMAVVLKAIEQFRPELAKASRHLTHGMVRMAGGQKMSSRQGNILSANDVLEAAAAANRAAQYKDNPDVVLGAVKYALLKPRLGGDIIYEPNESVSLEGNSGPYLQYAFARACSILRKAGTNEIAKTVAELEPDERSLLSKTAQYPEVVNQATTELMPHHICSYLYELSQSFNSFYEHNRVIDNNREAIRLALVNKYATILKNGLELLGIKAPESL